MARRGSRGRSGGSSSRGRSSRGHPAVKLPAVAVRNLKAAASPQPVDAPQKKPAVQKRQEAR